MLPWILAAIFLLLTVVLGTMLKTARAALEQERAMRAAARTKHIAELDTLKQEQDRTFSRQKRELAQVKERAHLPLAQDLFDGLDTLDMAIQNAEAHPNLSRDDLLSGISMARTSLHKALARHDVTPIDPQAAETAFDPRLHEAISVLEEENLPPDTIASVLRKGWTHPSKVLRPAMVQTSKLPALQSTQEDEEPIELDFSTPPSLGQDDSDEVHVADEPHHATRSKQ